jgi:precorrin-6Y C5,15-methyltransferase (decarboxylating)
VNTGPEPWLSVVGIGDAGLPSLSATARAIVENGEILVGGERHLAMVPAHRGERLRWRAPLEATLDALESLRGRRVVVLASGDPMCFGVGELLVRRFELSELRVLPAPSAFSLVCARLGWSLTGVACLSAHSRPLVGVRRHLAPGARLVVLSRDGSTADAIAGMLAEGGSIEHRRHRVHRRP